MDGETFGMIEVESFPCMVRSGAAASWRSVSAAGYNRRVLGNPY